MNHRHAVSKLAPVISLTERRARLVPIAVDLRQKQAHLDIILEALITAYREGSWSAVIEEWRYLEPSLRAQMDREEHDFLSAFRGVMRDDADELIAQHEELRDMLDVVGVGMDVHRVGVADLEALLTALREHTEHEEEHFYPWLDKRTSANGV